MFIESLQNNPVFFFTVVITVIVSVVLHELAHGVAAIWQGDNTPRASGHMTLNPVVHMGWFSLGLLAIAGIAWGQMPVNPARFRSRYGDAMVALAGPAMNLLLGLLALSAYAMWIRSAGLAPAHSTHAHGQTLLWTFGYFNIALLIFNLIPIPPLDGAHVLGDFYPPYKRWLANFSNPQVFIGAIFLIIIVASYTDFGLFDLSSKCSLWYVNVIFHAGLHFS